MTIALDVLGLVIWLRHGEKRERLYSYPAPALQITSLWLQTEGVAKSCISNRRWNSPNRLIAF
jgi:hypothetical protein